MRLGLALGSNLGHPLLLLRQAAADLHRELHRPSAPFLASSLYETEPMDCPPDSPPFLNAAVELETDLSPSELLRWTQSYEITQGRPADHGHHAPRTLDLDLLYLDEQSLDEPGLVLPHPRLAERLFVLVPLADIAPGRVLPGCPEGVAARARQLSTIQTIRRLPDPLWP